MHNTSSFKFLPVTRHGKWVGARLEYALLSRSFSMGSILLICLVEDLLRVGCVHVAR